MSTCLELLKMVEINNFQQEPDETLYQAWERFKELLMSCPQNYLTNMQKVILFYKGLEVPTRQILDSKTAIPTMTAANAKNSKLFFEPRQATIPFPSCLYDDCFDEENVSYGLKDLDAYSIGATLYNDALPQNENDLGSFTLPCYINNVYFEKSLDDLGVSVSVMTFLTYNNLRLCELAHTKLIVELAYRTVKHPKGIVENVLVEIGKFVFFVDFIILDMPKDVKVPLILGRTFLSTAHAKIDVFKRKITLRVEDEKIVFESVKPASSIIKRVYISLDPLYGDDIELNDLNEPLELRRNQIDDLKPTIEEGEVIDKPMFNGVKTRNDDAYHDEEMGEVIVGEPFCKASYVEARRFNGMITIFNDNDSVTYQMVRSHPRFKHLTNKQCNKIPPLLKVSEQDKMNGISHSYQKLKGFYKGILDL
ncbi:retrovirus-related pol polyprotein from transposon TNT 1-94 [Tanacetum coccineum]